MNYVNGNAENVKIAYIGGGAVYSVYCLCGYFGASVFVCAFVCASFGAAYSEICARICKIPAVVFLTPAIISIVPGSALNYTMSALVEKNSGLVLDKASQTLYISAGLVVGTIFITMITTIIEKGIRKHD